MWRPKDWAETTQSAVTDKMLNSANYIENVFEAGADAMLEALKSQDNKGIADNSYTGWWVFIPEREIEE